MDEAAAVVNDSIEVPSNKSLVIAEEAVEITFKPKPLVVNDIIAISVKSQEGKRTFFKIRRDTKLKKLLKSYCEKKFVDYPSTVFLINCERFNHDKSPYDMGLEDETEIEAMVWQMGA